MSVLQISSSYIGFPSFMAGETFALKDKEPFYTSPTLDL